MSIAGSIAGPVAGSVAKRVTEPGEVGGSTGLADGASITLATAFAGDTDPAYATTTISGSRYRRTSGGALELLGSNTPRLHTVSGGTGLLVEGTATNLPTYSQQFDNAAWTKANVTVTADAASAPDGMNSADKIIPAVSALSKYLGQNVTHASATHVHSVFAKNAGWPCFQLLWTGSVQGLAYANFDLSDGSSAGGGGATYGMEDFGGGWYRCWISATTSAASGNVFIWAVDSIAATRSAAGSAGDGVSGFYLWQADLVAASAPSSPILTTSGTGIRAADSIVIDCTHASINVPDGDTLRFTDTDSNTSDVVVASGSVTIPNSSWQAPWVTMTRVAA